MSTTTQKGHLDVSGVRALREGARKLFTLADETRNTYRAKLAELASPEASKKFTREHIDEQRTAARTAALETLAQYRAAVDRARSGHATLVAAWSDPLPILAASARFSHVPDSTKADGAQAQILEHLARAEARALVHEADDDELDVLVRDAATNNDLAVLPLLSREVPRRPANTAAAAKSALIDALENLTVPDADEAETLLNEVRLDLNFVDGVAEELRTNASTPPSSVSYRLWQQRQAAEAAAAAAQAQAAD